MQAIELKDISGDELVTAKEKSATPIRTVKTWVNIDKAIAIQDLSQRRARTGSPVSAVQVSP